MPDKTVSRIEAEEKEHEEKEEGPERWNSEKADGFRVGNESKALPGFDNIFYSFNS